MSKSVKEIQKKNHDKLTTVILIVILLVGLSVMLYPIVSNWWNSKTQSRAIARYQQQVEQLDDTEYQEILRRAHEYNEKLAKLHEPLLNYEQIPDYDNILDITGTGIMGFIDIPQIRVQLPIYHGTSNSVLNVAVGHYQGTSLPVGGADTHSAISAHRGLPSAKLFSDLDKLVVGDEFTVTVLKDVYTYEVEEIFIVLPDQTEKLNIIQGEDYLTLTTCTPYGINTHRLLVRAHRVETKNADGTVSRKNKIMAEAVQIDSLLVVPFVAAPLVFLLLMWWMFGGSIIKKRKFPHANPLSVFAEENIDEEKNTSAPADKFDNKGG